MRYFLLVSIGIMVLACSENKRSVRDLKVYYDLDSLLDAQVYALAKENVKTDKRVDMDGQEETTTEVYDTTQWRNEFRILRDFDLNKPYNVGAYDVEEGGDRVAYTLSDKTLDAPVKWFSVEKTQNGLEISAKYFEDKTIYKHQRKMKLVIEDGLISSFEITGFQKMILKDTTNYRINGIIRRS